MVMNWRTLCFFMEDTASFPNMVSLKIFPVCFHTGQKPIRRFSNKKIVKRIYFFGLFHCYLTRHQKTIPIVLNLICSEYLGPRICPNFRRLRRIFIQKAHSLAVFFRRMHQNPCHAIPDNIMFHTLVQRHNRQPGGHRFQQGIFCRSKMLRI